MRKELGTSLAFGVALIALLWMPRAAPRVAGLPDRLSDREFWTFVTDASEPGGYFRNENVTNLTSNELWFEEVIPDLGTRTKPGRVYLGVGPEQNFTYITAVKPKMAVIFDIRRGNLDMQLLYKAAFELSDDRAGFVSMIFSKPRPAGLTAASDVEAIFAAYQRVPASDQFMRGNLDAIRSHLTRTHGFALTPGDLAALTQIVQTLAATGFAVRASPTYADLMLATDAAGVRRSFLATAENFQFMKELETRNMLVPVVGDFGGPKAIRAVASYLRAHDAIVAAFYLSNVEQYLLQDGKWEAFCKSSATLPIDGSTTTIRSRSGGGFGFGRGGFVSSLAALQDDLAACR